MSGGFLVAAIFATVLVGFLVLLKAANASSSRSNEYHDEDK